MVHDCPELKARIDAFLAEGGHSNTGNRQTSE
jgi:hypothetical protein